MSSFAGERKLSSTSENIVIPTFYTNELPPSTNLPNDPFKKSADLSKASMEDISYSQRTDQATCPHERSENWNSNQCADCHIPNIGGTRVADEKRFAEIAKIEDHQYLVDQLSPVLGSMLVTRATKPGEDAGILGTGTLLELRDSNTMAVVAFDCNPTCRALLKQEKYQYVEQDQKCLVVLPCLELQEFKSCHARRIHGCGITIEALIDFAYKHNCWNWPTYKVMRDIIVPATKETRCRYADLPELTDCFGPATVFMSHCWGATFGDLIGAACHGARKDRIVWIDIFAVRQWPGNVADLDFRGVISRCVALVVSTSPVDGLKKFVMDHAAYFASDEGRAAKKTLPFFRLWCIVELTAAIVLDVPIVVKGGSVRKSYWNNEIYEYDTTCIGRLMANLMEMIDVDASECAVQADYDREMAVVRNLEGGSKGVNALIVCVVKGAFYSIYSKHRSSIRENVLEIDAFLCDEPESLRALNIPLGCEGEEYELAKKVFKAACAGGRESVVKELLLIWSVEEDDDQNKEGETKQNDSMKKEKEKKGIVYDENDGRLYFVCMHEYAVGCRNSPVMDDRCSPQQGVYSNECVVGTLTEDGQWICIVESNDEKQDGTFLPMAVGDDMFFKRITTKMEWNDSIKKEKQRKRNKWLIQLIDDSYVLCTASGAGHVGVVETLLEVVGINVNLDDDGDGTPLYRASSNGHTEVVKALLAAKDINVNQAGNKGETPLLIASKNGHTKVVKALLAAKDINVNKTDVFGQPPLDWATENNHTEIIQLLKDAGANCNNALFIASEKGNVEVVKILLAAKDINVNKASKFGRTPLDMATENNHTEIIQLLKDAGAQLYTLYVASRDGHTDVVKALLAAKDIDVNKTEYSGTPLDTATENNHTEIIQLLQDAGAQHCSLYSASKNGYTKVVKALLVDKDINVNKAIYDGSTPLDIATKNNHTEIIQLLKDAGAQEGEDDY
jgi:ankyrin repeat protein